MAVERAVESSQLLANCAVWMGTLSVWPSTRSGPAGRVVARMESMGMERHGLRRSLRGRSLPREGR